MECLQGYSEIVRINPKTEKQRYRGVQKVLIVLASIAFGYPSERPSAKGRCLLGAPPLKPWVAC